MMNMVFKPAGEVIITCTDAKINKEILFKMTYGIYDPYGYEYNYTIFDLARDPSIIDKIERIM